VVIDTSALLAILFDEAERASFNRRLVADTVRLMSAANYLEAAIILDDRLGEDGAANLRLYMADAAIRIMPVTVEQVDVARVAYRRYGRGNHPARLNFGDCFAYALAKTTDEPLLFKGEDFSQTDLEPA
jgi:ribonuclease VapC